MGMFIGNLKLEDIIKEDYLEKIKNFLNENGYRREVKCDRIEEEVGNYHIFHIPTQIQMCGEEKVKQFIAFLKEENLIDEAFKGRMSLSCVEHKKTNQ